MGGYDSTPRRYINSRGALHDAALARNTDGVESGTTAHRDRGVTPANTIYTSDDQIAIKGGHWVSDLIIAHNHFGTGHGMSIGSETYGTYISPDGVTHRGVENVLVYDLTIDGDSRAVGHDSSSADSNGIRVKSDPSRGGLSKNYFPTSACATSQRILYHRYNPLFRNHFRSSGPSIRDVRHVTCMERNIPS